MRNGKVTDRSIFPEIETDPSFTGIRAVIHHQQKCSIYGRLYDPVCDSRALHYQLAVFIEHQGPEIIQVSAVIGSGQLLQLLPVQLRYRIQQTFYQVYGQVIGPVKTEAATLGFGNGCSESGNDIRFLHKKGLRFKIKEITVSCINN